jgi:hypothetical protein
MRLLSEMCIAEKWHVYHICDITLKRPGAQVLILPYFPHFSEVFNWTHNNVQRCATSVE